jgi:hypothetical protein
LFRERFEPSESCDDAPNERKIATTTVIPRPGPELKAVEEACRETSRAVEPLNSWNNLNTFQLVDSRLSAAGTAEKFSRLTVSLTEKANSIAVAREHKPIIANETA